MNTNIRPSIATTRSYYLDYIASLGKAEVIVAPLVDSLSEECTVNAGSGSLWFACHNREDLVRLMTLAPRWSKHNEEGHLAYTATVDGVDIRLQAFDKSLPPTCHLEEREVEEPAQPARLVRKMVVVCSHSEPEPAPQSPVESDQVLSIDPETGPETEDRFARVYDGTERGST